MKIFRWPVTVAPIGFLFGFDTAVISGVDQPISEIFPNELPASGQVFGSFTHWVFAATITLLMPFVSNSFSGGPILLF